jgi:hypothetical protein
MEERKLRFPMNEFGLILSSLPLLSLQSNAPLVYCRVLRENNERKIIVRMREKLS